MKLNELKTDDAIFIDANIFLYHFTGVSNECKEFLKRCEAGDLLGVTSVTVMAEVCHHLMIAEAIQRQWIRPQKPVAQLQAKPEHIRNLSEYPSHLGSIVDWGIKIVTPPEDLLMKSQIFRSQYGLLTNDSLIPVYMKLANTSKLATNDQSFSRILSLQLYSPSDIGK
jgi:predicted nucleic acid-binding protein